MSDYFHLFILWLSDCILNPRRNYLAFDLISDGLKCHELVDNLGLI